MNIIATGNQNIPDPDDLRNIFESNTGKDLSWFFSDFIGTTKRIDYKVVRFDNQQILVKNKGEHAISFGNLRNDRRFNHFSRSGQMDLKGRNGLIFRMVIILK